MLEQLRILDSDVGHTLNGPTVNQCLQMVPKTHIKNAQTNRLLHKFQNRSSMMQRLQTLCDPKW